MLAACHARHNSLEASCPPHSAPFGSESRDNAARSPQRPLTPPPQCPGRCLPCPAVWPRVGPLLRALHAARQHLPGHAQHGRVPRVPPAVPQRHRRGAVRRPASHPRVSADAWTRSAVQEAPLLPVTPAHPHRAQPSRAVLLLQCTCSPPARPRSSRGLHALHRFTGRPIGGSR
jgi:hypothetical protein